MTPRTKTKTRGGFDVEAYLESTGPGRHVEINSSLLSVVLHD
jgi:hypothetical protein